jgi:hypothetical protein
MYRTFHVTSNWSSWFVLPYKTIDSPAAVLVGNELHIVVRDKEQKLWYGHVDRSGVFSNLTPLDGVTPSAPALTTNGTVLSLVIRGADDTIWYRFYELAAHKWTEWVVFPQGLTSDSPAAMMNGGKLYVVIRSADGFGIYYNTLELSTGNYSGWQTINGVTQSSPTLTAGAQTNEVFLIIRGADNRTFRRTLNDLNWTDWVPSENVSTCDGPGAAVVGEQLYLVIRDIGGINLWMQTVSLATGESSAPSKFLGETLSKPTLTG